MSSQKLYIPPLPEAQATTSESGIRALIQQSGLLEQGGTATEKISADNIDLVLNGLYKYGEDFTRKAVRELQSLGESDYTGVPYYHPDASVTLDNRGYYEVERVSPSPAQPNAPDARQRVRAHPCPEGIRAFARSSPAPCRAFASRGVRPDGGSRGLARPARHRRAEDRRTAR